MKQFYKLTIVGIIGLFLSGCSLIPTAWKSTRLGGEAQPTSVPTAAPTLTVEEFDESVTADLETEMDADLKQIDEDLKTIESEAKDY